MPGSVETAAQRSQRKTECGPLDRIAALLIALDSQKHAF
jgi:hypothetical protein